MVFAERTEGRRDRHGHGRKPPRKWTSGAALAPSRTATTWPMAMTTPWRSIVSTKQQSIAPTASSRIGAPDLMLALEPRHLVLIIIIVDWAEASFDAMWNLASGGVRLGEPRLPRGAAERAIRTARWCKTRPWANQRASNTESARNVIGFSQNEGNDACGFATIRAR